MTDYELKDIDSEDISDLLVKVEKSFNIKFGDKELMHISTFGELCDQIINKIQPDALTVISFITVLYATDPLNLY